jgi:allene oxide cyclase
MRRGLLVGGVLVLVAGCLAAVAVARGSLAPQLTGPRVIRVVEHPVHETLVDLGTSGDSQGDTLAFANPLYDATNTHVVGRDQGSCIRVVKGAAFQCNWTAWVTGGSVTVEGPFYDTRDSLLAVLGGTGVFANARGQMLLHARDDGNFEFVYNLQP